MNSAGLPRLHLVIGIVLSLLSAIVIGFKLDWNAPVPTPGLVAMVLWPTAPTLMATGLGWLLRKSHAALICSLAGLLTSFGTMAFMYIYAFHINPDPQGGLVLIFGPPGALLILAPFALGAVILHARRDKGKEA